MLASSTCRTLIIENQPLFGKALAHVLAQDASITVAGDANSVTEACVKSTRPDLILIDIDCQIDLVEVVRVSRAAAPDVKVCVLSMHLQPDTMQKCLNAGADAYIAKDVAPSELIRALKSVANGEQYVDPRIAGRLLKRRAYAQVGPDPNDLSVRELEVVRHIVAGMSNKEISTNLHLSEKTIKNHVSRIFSKFNCTARTQAAVYALRTGLA